MNSSTERRFRVSSTDSKLAISLWTSIEGEREERRNGGGGGGNARARYGRESGVWGSLFFRWSHASFIPR